MAIQTKFAHENFELIAEKVLYQGFFRMVNRQLRYQLYRGGMSKPLNREVMLRQTAAGVLPYDPHTDTVILIEQFRPGAIDHPPTSPWLLELVAGILDTNETPEALSIREAKEEAGCDILDLTPICDYFVSPGGSNEYFNLYCGRVKATFTENIYGLAEEHEDIRAICLPCKQAFNLLKTGQIKTAPLIIALQWLQLNQTWLKQLWQIK